jgi:hypothetical protein
MIFFVDVIKRCDDNKIKGGKQYMPQPPVFIIEDQLVKRR